VKIVSNEINELSFLLSSNINGLALMQSVSIG